MGRNAWKWLGGALVALSLSTPTLAQDDIPHIQGDGDQIPRASLDLHSAAQGFDSPSHARGLEAPIYKSVILQLPHYPGHRDAKSFLSQTSLLKLPEGSLHTDYEGFQSYVARRLQSRYRSFWRRELRQQNELRDFTPAQLRGRYEQFYNAFGDMRTGRWWEREWFHSLPEEKGGAPAQAYVQTIGRDITWQVGPLQLSNTLKVRFDKYAVLSFTPDPGRVYRDLGSANVELARDYARLSRSMMVEGEAADEELDDERLPMVFPSIDLAPAERSSFLEGLSWRFKARPRIRLRLPSDYDPNRVLKKISGRMSLDIYLGASRNHVASLDGELSYDHHSGDLAFSLNLALLSW